MEILQWKCAALVGGRNAIDFGFYRKLFPGSWILSSCGIDTFSIQCVSYKHIKHVFIWFFFTSSRVYILTNKVLDYFLLFCLLEVTYVFLDRMGSELAGKHIENLLPDPAALCEGGEGEVVGVDLAQTWHSSVTKVSYIQLYRIQFYLNMPMIVLTVFNIIRSLAIAIICEPRSFRLQCLRLELRLKLCIV